MKRFYAFFKKKFKSPDVYDESLREIAHKDAHQLIADAKNFLSTGETTKNLKERIDSLLAQDSSIKAYDALEILLDYAERTLRK